MPLRYPCRRLLLAVGSVSAVVLGFGCVSKSRNLPVYDPSQVNQVQTVEMGTVDVVRAVIIKGDTGPATSTGGRVGSSLGRSVAMGRDPATAIAGAAGSVVGEIAGKAVEEGVKTKEGQQITVVLDDGSVISVVQENDPPYVGGERVRVVHTGSRVEVRPADEVQYQ